MVSPPAEASCPICALHGDQAELTAHEIWRNDLWLLRHHPRPAPLAGWCLLDSRRHCGGPINFVPEEAQDWGVVVQRASQLVRAVTGCERVYAIAFGEGALHLHLHLHLIPRSADDPRTSAWKIADLYRDVEAGKVTAASADCVNEWVLRARDLASAVLD